MAKAAAAVRPSLKQIEFTPGSIKGAAKATGATTRSVYMVPLDMIQVKPGFNLRITDTAEYKADIEDLKQSMLAEGFYETKPLAGFASIDAEGEDCVIVTDGHRRLEAARLAAAEEGGDRFERLPVIFKKATTSSLDLAVSLDKENAAKPLSMLERAVLVKRMQGDGLSDEEVASRLGITERYVADLKLLISAPKAVRQLVSSGKIAGTEAVQQLRKNAKDPEAAAVKLQTLAAKAEKAGAPRLTKERIKRDAETPSVKMQTTTSGFSLSIGETAALEAVEPFLDLLGNEWYEMSSRPNEIRALEAVSIEVKIRRPKRETTSDEPVADDDDAAFDTSATDLHKAGIADPVTDNAGL